LVKEVLAGGSAAAVEPFAASGALNKQLVAGFAGTVGVVIAGFTTEITFS
jgi:hypothetical protein